MKKNRRRFQFCSCEHENRTYYFYCIYDGGKKVYISANYRSREEMMADAIYHIGEEKP